MKQVHTLPEGRKPQGQHQDTFTHTWNKFTHLLRSENHKDNISTHLHRHGTSSHTNYGQEITWTASADICAQMEQVHAPPKSKKITRTGSAHICTHME